MQICFHEVFMNRINYVTAPVICYMVECNCDFILFRFSYFPFVSCNELHMLHPAKFYCFNLIL